MRRPATFAPNQVIKGWTEAMQLMVEGDKWEMYIPSELGYGDSGSGAKIPGGSVLVFQMEIIKIKGDKVAAIKCQVKTLDDCSDQEKAYVEKQSSKSKDDLAKEIKRLEGMTKATAAHLQQWKETRLVLLNRMKEEL